MVVLFTQCAYPAGEIRGLAFSGLSNSTVRGISGGKPALTTATWNSGAATIDKQQTSLAFITQRLRVRLSSTVLHELTDAYSVLDFCVLTDFVCVERSPNDRPKVSLRRRPTLSRRRFGRIGNRAGSSSTASFPGRFRVTASSAGPPTGNDSTILTAEESMLLWNSVESRLDGPIRAVLDGFIDRLWRLKRRPAASRREPRQLIPPTACAQVDPKSALHYAPHVSGGRRSGTVRQDF